MVSRSRWRRMVKRYWRLFVNNRAWRIGAIALPLLTWMAAPGAAAEPSITILNSAATTDYRDQLDRLSSDIMSDATLAAQGTNDIAAMYVDLNAPLDQVSGFDSLTTADQALLRAVKRTYDLYLALGGEVIDRSAVLQRQDNRYYVGLDGEGGRWVATVEEALTTLLDELVNFTTFRFSVEQAAAACPFDFHCLLLATYMGMIETVAYVPRGTTVTLVMTGDGFGNEGGPPVLLVPDHFIVHEVTFVGSEMISARVSVDITAPLGVNVFGVYNEGSAFRSVERYGVHVVANAEELEAFLNVADSQEATDDQPQALVGSGEFQPLSDDHSGEREFATALSGTVSGRLDSPNDVDLFEVIVEKAGTLAVFSSGPTDVRVTLETSDGGVIATDDDSGVWYNFRLERAVRAGTYYVRVTHCCAGMGAYRVSSTMTPN